VLSIIAVHGLDGDAMKSWTCETIDPSVNWLQHPEFLPKAFPDARVMTYGYDSKPISDRTSTATLREHGDDLIQEIMVIREETNVCPSYCELKAVLICT
jgi:hypothetical protein